MKLLSLKASRYRSLREETIFLSDLNLFIGINASGKSTILDALSFLHEGLQQRDFGPGVSSRGAMVSLAWAGEETADIELTVELREDTAAYEWKVRLRRIGPSDFSVCEEVIQKPVSNLCEMLLLKANDGKGWWLSGEKQVPLALNGIS